MVNRLITAGLAFVLTASLSVGVLAQSQDPVCDIARELRRAYENLGPHDDIRSIMPQIPTVEQAVFTAFGFPLDVIPRYPNRIRTAEDGTSHIFVSASASSSFGRGNLVTHTELHLSRQRANNPERPTEHRAIHFPNQRHIEINNELWVPAQEVFQNLRQRVIPIFPAHLPDEWGRHQTHWNPTTQQLTLTYIAPVDMDRGSHIRAIRELYWLRGEYDEGRWPNVEYLRNRIIETEFQARNIRQETTIIILTVGSPDIRVITEVTYTAYDYRLMGWADAKTHLVIPGAPMTQIYIQQSPQAGAQWEFMELICEDNITWAITRSLRIPNQGGFPLESHTDWLPGMDELVRERTIAGNPVRFTNSRMIDAPPQHQPEQNVPYRQAVLNRRTRERETITISQPVHMLNGSVMAPIDILLAPFDLEARPVLHTQHWEIRQASTGVRVTADMRDVEREVLRLVNIERANVGAPPLQWCDALANASRAHALDSLVWGYIAHNCPNGITPPQRALEHGAPFLPRGGAEDVWRNRDWTVFENGVPFLGGNTATEVATLAVRAWMNSTLGHRENMLRSSHTHLGVGFMSSGSSYVGYAKFAFTR